MRQVSFKLSQRHQIYLVLFVLSCIWKTRNDSSHARRRRNLARVDHNEKFHDHVVHFTAATLNDEHVFSTNGLTNLYTTSMHANHNATLHSKTSYYANCSIKCSMAQLGVVASVVRRMNEVTLRRTRLVLG